VHQWIIHESIVDPAAYTEAGFPDDRMPRFFRENLSDHEVASLVAFLLDSVSG
jgi:hypothetical protein